MNLSATIPEACSPVMRLIELAHRAMHEMESSDKPSTLPPSMFTSAQLAVSVSGVLLYCLGTSSIAMRWETSSTNVLQHGCLVLALVRLSELWMLKRTWPFRQDTCLSIDSCSPGRGFRLRKTSVSLKMELHHDLSTDWKNHQTFFIQSSLQFSEVQQAGISHFSLSTVTSVWYSSGSLKTGILVTGSFLHVFSHLQLPSLLKGKSWIREQRFRLQVRNKQRS